jgi:hypothetical protein
MPGRKDEFSPDELLFLQMIQNQHRTTMEIAGNILRQSPSPEIYQIASSTLQSIGFMMNEINKLTN